MTVEIRFPEFEPQYLFDRDALVFRALSDGKSLACLVSAELLYSRFGAQDFSEDTLRQAYRAHRAELEEIARHHIENGWIDEEGRVFLTTRYTRLKVSFSGELHKWVEGLAFAKSGHRVLTEVIGPNAEDVDVKWGYNTAGDIPMVDIRIGDPSIEYWTNAAVSAPFTAPNIQRMLLASLWGKVLRARSKELILKSG